MAAMIERAARRRLGIVLYGALFCVVLPAVLVWWTLATADDIPLRPFHPPIVGLGAVVLGCAMMLAGGASLWRHGGGLPMNAFPPPRLVTTGIYGLIPHPIYIGFSLVVAGASMFFESASGLWLVTPTVALGCAALTLGYEAPDLKARFGAAATATSRWLPEDSPARPDWRDRLRCYLFMWLPWIAFYYLVTSAGVPHDAVDVQLAFERHLPILTPTEPLYISVYIIGGIAPLFAPSRRALRRFMIRGWIATAVIMPFYLAVPTLAPRRPFTPTSPLGHLLAWERGTYPPMAAFPSFHVIWVMLVAQMMGAASLGWRGPHAPLRSLAFRVLRSPVLWWSWAIAVSVSCVTTGMHAIPDIVAGFAAGAVLLRIDGGWSLLRRATERVANSWHEWRFGPVRLINHGFYAGLATLVCLTIVGVLVGPSHTALVLLGAVAAVLGSAAWAQWIEGSPRLLRPYGFYGGVAGIAVASLAAPAFGASPWLMLAAFSVGAPFVQSIGRLRCLVQGCCHGHPTTAEIGIRYVHPRSRVCRLTAYAGVPLHATQLYSIIWNGFVALLLCRLWVVGAPLHFIAGVFLITTGLGRFVEEAYRGEPQTPVLAGLRLYQWVAIATVLGGILVTGLAASSPAPAAAWTPHALVVAALFGAVTTLAFGVDLPESRRRFGRLT